MSNTFAMTAQMLAQRAYRRLGVLPAARTPTDDQFTQFLICYNSMALGAQADGINLFRQTQLSLTIPTGVGYAGNPYQIVPMIMNFEAARWVITPAPNLYERPLGEYSYADYMNLPNKQAQSQSPSVICFDRQVTSSNIYLWPLPSSGGTLNMSVARQVNSIAAPSDPIDFPVEWIEGLSYIMADRLMDDEGVAAADEATATRITQRAVAFYAKLLNFDRPTSVFIRPMQRGHVNYFRG